MLCVLIIWLTWLAPVCADFTLVTTTAPQKIHKQTWPHATTSAQLFKLNIFSDIWKWYFQLSKCTRVTRVLRPSNYKLLQCVSHVSSPRDICRPCVRQEGPIQWPRPGPELLYWPATRTITPTTSSLYSALFINKYLLFWKWKMRWQFQQIQHKFFFQNAWIWI